MKLKLNGASFFVDTDIIKPQKPKPVDSESTPDSASSEDSTNTELPTEPVLEVAPETPAKPNKPTPKSEEQKERKSNRTLTLIFMALALCGLGFGIYGVFFQQQTNKCETAIVEEKPEKELIRGTSDSSHFYFGELGLKLEIPEEYKGKLSYLYRDDGTVLVWGYNSAERPEFANPLSESSAPLFLINTSVNELTDGKDSYTDGTKIFVSDGTECYLHLNRFENTENSAALKDLADTFYLLFIDTNKYSNF